MGPAAREFRRFTDELAENAELPPNPELDDKPLPWVERVEHLGHILQSNGSMEADACRARASFNRRADDIRDNLFFAHPKQVVQGIQLYCCDGFGAML